MGSLQEALLKSGLAREDRTKHGRTKGAKKGPAKGDKNHSNGRTPDARSGARVRQGKPEERRRSARKSKPDSRSTDLERAWAERRKAEKAEKEKAQKARVADQEARRKRNLELDRIVEGRILNVEGAEVPRYFEHLGRIRRVLCTLEQREMINDGRLGVVNLRGRYLIVEPDVLEAYRVRADDLVPDLGSSEPESPEEDWPPVPDDMIW